MSDPFPVSIQQKSFLIHNVNTDILCLGFSNKIMVIVTQLGKIGSILNCIVDNPDGGSINLDESGIRTPEKVEKYLVNSRFILGYNNETTSQYYQILASQISNKILADNPLERRPVLLATALSKNVLDDYFTLKDTIKAIPEIVGLARVW